MQHCAATDLQNTHKHPSSYNSCMMTVVHWDVGAGRRQSGWLDVSKCCKVARWVLNAEVFVCLCCPAPGLNTRWGVDVTASLTVNKNQL